MLLRAGAGEGAARPMPSGSGAGETDEPAAIVRLDERADVDPIVRERARRIAARLSVPRPRTVGRRRGSGERIAQPYRGDSDELDIDRTVDQLVEHPWPDEEDIVVRERVRERRAVVLLVDVSGSAKGERVRTAAATVGALAAELERDALAVIAFWSDAAVLLELGDPVRPQELLDTMLRIPARGLTNLSFPLQLAVDRVAGRPERTSRAILLSDCVHNAGPDPRPIAARLPRLDVLLDMTGEKDVELGRELARLGRGSFHPLRSYLDVAPALVDAFRE